MEDKSQIYFPGGPALKAPQISMFLYIFAGFGGHPWYTLTYKRQGSMLIKHNTSSAKIPLHPKWQHLKNIFVDFTLIYVHNKCAKTISYQFKRATTLWKKLKRLQYMQRTWWQIVVTSFTRLIVLPKSLCTLSEHMHVEVNSHLLFMWII